jgi:two-component system, OmpR family, alkaline phosphatase synthesis response regulator PhoP
MKRILLAEDEESLRETLTLNLELEGYTVVACEDGKKALAVFRSERFDLAILDVMLPEIDGFSLCKIIRLEDARLPIIFLTAKNTGTDRVQGLKLGADDYIAKPFNLEELLLRINNLLKRAESNTPHPELKSYAFGGNKVNFDTYEVANYANVVTQLSKRETLLLKLLIERKNEVVSRQEILESVWGYDVFPSTRTIDNYILQFRKIFEPDPKESKYFHAIRGVGYKFTPDKN